MNKVETLDLDGYTVSIYHDDDCTSPREFGGTVGLFLGFPHRRYKIGDERFNPDDVVVGCPNCIAGGRCQVCDGWGNVTPKSLADLIAWVKYEYDARVALPVGMHDHSGISYYIGAGPARGDAQGWDSGLCGLILDTPDRIKETVGDDATDEQIIAALTGEIEEYSDWVGGFCYGYSIEAPDGEEIGDCWGFIGINCWDKGGYMYDTFKSEVEHHRATVHGAQIEKIKRMIARGANQRQAVGA